MTTNAFLMMWDCYGIEAVVPISEYEDLDVDNSMRILAGENVRRDPLGSMLFNMKMRARYNPQRNYEIYAIDCDKTFTTEIWLETWKDEPQATANLVRERGIKLYSDRKEGHDERVVII